MFISPELNELISDYNELASKKRLKTRLFFNGNILLLGSIEQFEVGSYQCILSNDDIQVLKVIVNSMIKQLCFEYGE